MSDQGGWVAVFYTNDGPDLDGPHETREEAFNAILTHYRDEYGLTEAEALDRYDSSPNEWVSRISTEPKGARPAPPAIGGTRRQPLLGEAEARFAANAQLYADAQERAVVYLQAQRDLTHEYNRAVEADAWEEAQAIRAEQNRLAEQYLTANREGRVA